MHVASVPRLLLAISLLAGCRDAAFKAASRQDTTQAWRSFIAGNPADENLDAAKARLSEIEFGEARQVHSVIAYKRFLEAHPDAGQARAAKAALEALRFNTAKDAKTASALRQFVKEHPDGAHRDEADALLKSLELVEVATLDNPATLARIAAENPDDPRALEVSSRLDEVAWSQATTPQAQLAYLKQFAAGAHRDAARVALLSTQLEGLLISGAVAEAEALANKSPLRGAVPRWAQRLEAARVMSVLERARDEKVLRALPGWTRRSFDDVVKSLEAPDPMDRWQAVEELGTFVSVKAFDPLLHQLKSARNARVRQAAFEALQKVVRALPHDVAAYELAVRLDALEQTASDAQLFLIRAVLLDLSGQLERASLEYQRAWDPQSVDPVVLRRWLVIRAERRQVFASAVAARQLATWARAEASEVEVSPATALSASRTLCAANENAELAARTIAEARTKEVEFPDDLEGFDVRAREAVRLTRARLRDAELLLLEADAKARTCADAAVSERMAAGERDRLAALAALKQTGKVPAGLLELVRLRDPSVRVREAAK